MGFAHQARRYCSELNDLRIVLRCGCTLSARMNSPISPPKAPTGPFDVRLRPGGSLLDVHELVSDGLGKNPTVERMSSCPSGPPASQLSEDVHLEGNRQATSSFLVSASWTPAPRRPSSSHVASYTALLILIFLRIPFPQPRHLWNCDGPGFLHCMACRSRVRTNWRQPLQLVST